MTMFTPFASLKPTHYPMSSKLPAPLSSSNSVRFGMDRPPNGQDGDQISGKKRKLDTGNQPVADRSVRQANVQAQPQDSFNAVPTMPADTMTKIVEFSGSDFWSLNALLRTAKSFSQIAENSHYLRMAEARRLTSLIKDGAPGYELLLPLQLHGPVIERMGVLDKVKQMRGNPPIKVPAIKNLVKGMNHLTFTEQKELLSSVKKQRRRDAYVFLAKGVKHLPPQLREQLVAKIITLLKDERKPESIKADAIAGLGQCLEALSDAQRNEVVTCAIALRSEIPRALAIAGLGKGLEALSDDQRGQLVTHTINLTFPEFRALAIAGLGHSLEALSDDQRGQLVTCATTLPDVRSQVRSIEGLGKGLEVLSDAQRGQLVTCAIGLPDGWPRAEAIAGLGHSLEALSDDQRGQLVTHAINLSNEASRAQAIAGLGHSLEALSDDQRGQLVDLAIALNPLWRAKAIAGLGHSLKALSDAERGQLVDCAVALPDGKQRAKAIDGLRHSLEALSDTERGQLVACAIALPETNPVELVNKTDAISHLAEGLQKLYELASPST